MNEYRDTMKNAAHAVVPGRREITTSTGAARAARRSSTRRTTKSTSARSGTGSSTRSAASSCSSPTRAIPPNPPSRATSAIPPSRSSATTQLAWLKKSLEEMKALQHVFVFMHHPRWAADLYPGNNWDEVHQLLVANGNVSACFAGHIHRLRYDGDQGRHRILHPRRHRRPHPRRLSAARLPASFQRRHRPPRRHQGRRPAGRQRDRSHASSRPTATRTSTSPKA